MDPRELRRPPRWALAPAAAVQLALAGYAWADLARRPHYLVRGPKPVWAAVIGINFVGPIVYLRFGRTGTRRQVAREAAHYQEDVTLPTCSRSSRCRTRRTVPGVLPHP